MRTLVWRLEHGCGVRVKGMGWLTPVGKATCSSDVAGDTTRNLVWRLEHGEGPERLRPAVVVIQIGTNDLTQPEHPLVRAAVIFARPRSALSSW